VEDGVANEFVVKLGGGKGDRRRVRTHEVRDGVARAVADETQARLERVAAARAVDEEAATVDVAVEGEDSRVQSVGDDVGRAHKTAQG